MKYIVAKGLFESAARFITSSMWCMYMYVYMSCDVMYIHLSVSVKQPNKDIHMYEDE